MLLFQAEAYAQKKKPGREILGMIPVKNSDYDKGMGILLGWVNGNWPSGADKKEIVKSIEAGMDFFEIKDLMLRKAARLFENSSSKEQKKLATDSVDVLLGVQKYIYRQALENGTKKSNG